MRFEKLRLTGFKSFVEPTDFIIERGLTGVVGPNGCGKSNLVEALRWVMGENSYKNMRASGMDDVIFSGSGTRPARNTAEVALFLKNADRTAPAAFNDSDEIQVTRRIAREAGSVYRINGKEARAKDVQLLFADQSTGARSPSMVGQGRIGELIQAKPQARRALLEEAAGISGLHSRRHEAELRLRAAESNLERLDDVVAELESQIESLKRQARQATRFKALSKDIRAAEATVLHLRWTAAKAQESEAKSQLAQATNAVAEKAQAQMNAAKDQAVAAHRLPGLRDEEAKAAAALQRLTIARTQLEDEAKRLVARRTELERRIQQLAGDLARERALLDDNAGALDRLTAEEAALNRAQADAQEKAPSIAQALQQAEAHARACEATLQGVTAERAAAAATRSQLARQVGEARQRLAKIDSDAGGIRRQLEALAVQAAALPNVAARQAEAQAAAGAVTEAERRATEAEAALEAARKAEAAARPALTEARATLNRVETEARTLAKVLNAANPGLFAPVVESLKVARGYETALGAALGEDLELSTDPNAPAYWAVIGSTGGDPALPQGVASLAEFVDAPPALARRLAQTGVVDTADGERLQSLLHPGQRLVARDGALWRWDGVTVRADAPTPAAQRLAQKNRLAELDGELVAARAMLATTESSVREAEATTRAATDADRAAREAVKTAQTTLARAREAVAAAERSGGELARRRAVLDEQEARAAADRLELTATLADHEAALAQAPDPAALEARYGEANAKNATARGQLAEARAASQDFTREADTRARRLAAIAAERESWVKRAANAEGQIATLAAREAETASELAGILDQPEELEFRQRELGVAIRTAEQERKQAADRLVEAETSSRDADRKAAEALNALAQAREARGRAEERQLAAEERRAEAENRIRDTLHCAAHEAFRLTELDPVAPLPDLEPIERNLEKLRIEREKLGAVNLRAEEEVTELSERHGTIVTERVDVLDAIAKLREAIGSLNAEGRERLMAAFGVVDEHFRKLFTHLFGGGTAELQLIESDDPLEAGLEILARPPGKKPQTMTLLSGGEQALTAMALIFAVFLTNPAPICVLDEVDAPLDDHNVERFCDLMDEMARQTETRFVIITHNPITMARMDRLFGVTMAEQGVSQLVSVDLRAAEALREAG